MDDMEEDDVSIRRAFYPPQKALYKSLIEEEGEEVEEDESNSNQLLPGLSGKNKDAEEGPKIKAGLSSVSSVESPIASSKSVKCRTPIKKKMITTYSGTPEKGSPRDSYSQVYGSAMDYHSQSGISTSRSSSSASSSSSLSSASDKRHTSTWASKPSTSTSLPPSEVGTSISAASPFILPATHTLGFSTTSPFQPVPHMSPSLQPNISRKHFSVHVVGGSSSSELAAAISRKLGTPLEEVTTTTFADGEKNIHINKSVRGSDLYLVQSIAPPKVRYVRDYLFVS